MKLAPIVAFTTIALVSTVQCQTTVYTNAYNYICSTKSLPTVA